MDFDNLAHWLIAILWLVSLVLVYTFTRKQGEGESLLAKLFTSNTDLDSTLKLILRAMIVFSVLIIVVVFFSMFHDDLDASHVGMLGSQIIGMAGVAIASVTGKGNGDDNGQQNGDKKE